MAKLNANEFCLRAKYFWDGKTNSGIKDGAVWVRDGRIIDSGPYEKVRVPDNVIEINYKNASIIPGLIDGHTHTIMTGLGMETHEYMALQPNSMLYDIAKENAHQHLLSGVTTLFDNGGKDDVVIRVRDAIHKGELIGSDIWSSKTCVRRYCKGIADLGGDVDGDDPLAVARITERFIVKDKVDWIKIYFTRGGFSQHLFTARRYHPHFSHGAFLAMTNTAHEYGRKVGGHCVTNEGISAFVDGRGDCIIHCEMYNNEGIQYEDPVILGKIIDSGTWVNPTLYTAIGTVKTLMRRDKYISLTPEQQQRVERGLRVYDFTAKSIFKLWNAGVPMYAGSDSGFAYGQFGTFRYELYELHEIGIPVIDVLKMATVNPAKYMEKENEIGNITKGADADITVCAGNVFADLHALENIIGVYKKGKKIV